MDGDTKTVLVTGVRGKTGVHLARRLVRRGVRVRGGSASPDTVALDGVEPVALDWDDPAGWSAAAHHVDAVYLVRPDRPDAPELMAGFLAEVPATARVVLLSERHAEDTGAGGWAARGERAVTRSGRTWVVLRPSWFAQVFTDDRFYRDLAIAGGELAFPSGGASVAWIDADDIAAVAERALLDGGHDGEVLELSGPEALSLPRTAEVLSATAAAPVVHRDAPVEETVAGLEGFDRDLTVLTFERVRAGRYAGVTHEVERVTGRPPRPLTDVLGEALGGRSARP